MRHIRYTLEMHPSTVDSARPVPNAWLCKGWDEAGTLVVMQCGNTARDALAAAQRPDTPAQTVWQRVARLAARGRA